jgi:hypothetical protein
MATTAAGVSAMLARRQMEVLTTSNNFGRTIQVLELISHLSIRFHRERF